MNSLAALGGSDVCRSALLSPASRGSMKSRSPRFQPVLDLLEERLGDLPVAGLVRMQAVGADQIAGNAAERRVEIDDECAFGRRHRADLIVGWRDEARRVAAARADTLG